MAPTHDHGPSSTRTWAALGVLYVVWGSTYLAIRVAIETLPPFLMAGVRFLVAGAVLYAWAAWRGDVRRERPGFAQWRAATIVGAALLLGGNGGVVWAEERIASGVAALLVATLPLWMALLERIVHGQALRAPTIAGVLLGLLGLALLLDPRWSGVDPAGALVCTFAPFAWGAGSLYARRAPLPRAPRLATAMEMLAGGALLVLVGLVFGEASAVHPSAFSMRSVAALAYLVVFGSLLAFSAYIWLLGMAPMSLITTYAYVNPVVAVVLGWALLGEPITSRMLLAGGVIVAAVAIIISSASRRSAPPAAARPDRAAPPPPGYRRRA